MSLKCKPTMTPEELVTYRKSLQFNRQTFAELIGVTKQAVVFWEDGQRSIPETTVRLLKLFQKYPQLIGEF